MIEIEGDMMRIKTKKASRPGWNRVTKKEYQCVYECRDDFKGYVSRLTIVDIKTPLRAYFSGKKIKVADIGYTWYMLFPKDKHYALTAMVDGSGQVIQCYFDIIDHTYIDEHGIPSFEDWFLDVVITDYACEIVDMDELSQALLEGVISSEDANTAYLEADALFRKVDHQFDALAKYVRSIVTCFDEKKQDD